MSPGPRRIPDALLERHLAGALDPQTRAGLEATLAESPADRARLEELRADSMAFLLRHPPEPVVARWKAPRRPLRWRRGPALFASALAVAAAVVLLVLKPGEDPYIAKGGVGLVLYRKVDGTSARVWPDEPLVPGDALRFEVRGEKDGYVAVLGRDARGTVTVYHPFGGLVAAPYAVAHPLLSTAIELDETLGTEELYALYSARPFELGATVRALQQGLPPEAAVPAGVKVGHARITKRGSR